MKTILLIISRNYKRNIYVSIYLKGESIGVKALFLVINVRRSVKNASCQMMTGLIALAYETREAQPQVLTKILLPQYIFCQLVDSAFFLWSYGLVRFTKVAWGRTQGS